MERQGAAWGARREVIYRAVSAINELFEAVTSSGLAEGKVEMEVAFDEFNLEVEARYEGEPPVLPSVRPGDDDLLEEGAVFSGVHDQEVRRLGEGGIEGRGYAASGSTSTIEMAGIYLQDPPRSCE